MLILALLVQANHIGIPSSTRANHVGIPYACVSTYSYLNQEVTAQLSFERRCRSLVPANALFACSRARGGHRRLGVITCCCSLSLFWRSGAMLSTKCDDGVIVFGRVVQPGEGLGGRWTSGRVSVFNVSSVCPLAPPAPSVSAPSAPRRRHRRRLARSSGPLSGPANRVHGWSSRCIKWLGCTIPPGGAPASGDEYSSFCLSLVVRCMIHCMHV